MAGVLQTDKVVFYHPLNSNKVDATQGQTWTGTETAPSGVVSQAMGPVEASTVTVGSACTTASTNQFLTLCALDSTRVIATYADAAGHGVAKLGTISGTDITWGVPSLFDACSNTMHIRCCQLTSSSFFVSYAFYVSPYYGAAKVGVVSGSEITFGPLFKWADNGSVIISNSLCKLSSTKAFLAYKRAGTKVKVATVNGTDITFTAEFTASSNTNTSPYTSLALDSTHAVVYYIGKGASDSTGGAVKLATINGSDITFSPEAVFTNQNINGVQECCESICCVGSNRIAVTWASNQAGNPPYYVGQCRIGVISGSEITFGTTSWFTGTNQHGMYTTLAELDSSRFIVFCPYSTGDNVFVRIATVSGVDVTYGPKTILNAATTSANARCAVLSSKKYVFSYDQAARVGTAYPDASLTASNGNAFLTAVNKTRVTTAFWAKNPTKDGGSVVVKRGYTVTLGENAITLGTATATWNTTLAVNDGANHLIALDFEHQGGTNWKLRTSVDGGAWVDRGTQASGSQALAAANTTPNIAMTNPAGDGWVDETVMWVNADLFTTGELQNLYDLSQVFGDSMDQYESNFGAPLCWQATARMSDGSIWRDSGAGPCPQVLRVPAGASDIVVTDDGHRVNPVISEG